MYGGWVSKGGDKRGIRERLSLGHKVLGTWSSIPSAGLVEAIGCSGLDFVVIDAEHGPVSVETAEGMVRAAEAASMAPVVRVPANRPEHILRVLDIGAHGVQVPHVRSRSDAEAAVKYARYHPLGSRGLSPFTRAGRYGTAGEDHARTSNESTLVVVNVEGVEGVENLEEIASVPGVDVIFLGPYDLSQSLGVPGQVDHPRVVEMIERSAKSVMDGGIACGSFARDKEYMKMLIGFGVSYLTYMVDTAVALSGYSEAVADFARSAKER